MSLMRENSCRQIICTSLKRLVLYRYNHPIQLQRNYWSLTVARLVSSVARLLNQQNGLVQLTNSHTTVRYFFNSKNFQQNLRVVKTLQQQQLPSSQRISLLFRAKNYQKANILTYWKINCQIFQRFSFHTFQYKRHFSAVSTVNQFGTERNLIIVKSHNKKLFYLFSRTFSQENSTMMVWVSDYDKPKVTQLFHLFVKKKIIVC